MSTQVEIPAGSAPAPEAPEVSVQDRLDQATHAELETWRKTGDIPAVKVKSEAPPKPAEAAPAEAPKKEEPAKPAAAPPAKGETAAAPPAAPPQKQETKSEKRWRELSEAYGDTKRELEELRRQIASRPEPPKGETAAPPAAAEPKKAAAEAEPELSGVNSKTGKPFQTIAEWQKEHSEWMRKEILAEVEGRTAKAEQARTQTEYERTVADEVIRKSQPAMTKYKDFEAVAADPNLPIPKGSPVDLFIKDSDNPGEVLYYLGKHPEVLAEFYGCKYNASTKTWDYGDFDFKTGKYTNHVNPIRQVRRLEAIERELTAAPEKKPAEPAPVNPVPPKLPPPPTEVSGRKAAPIDEAENALARGDMATYMRIKNAEDLKASRR